MLPTLILLKKPRGHLQPIETIFNWKILILYSKPISLFPFDFFVSIYDQITPPLARRLTSCQDHPHQDNQDQSRPFSLQNYHIRYNNKYM